MITKHSMYKIKGAIMRKLFLALLLTSTLAFSAEPKRPFTMAIIDTSSTNITTGYDGAGAEVQTGLASPGHLLIWNETGSNIGVSVPTGDSCLVSSPDHFISPGAANGAGVAADLVAVNKVVCLRSLTGLTIMAGDVYVSVW